MKHIRWEEVAPHRDWHAAFIDIRAAKPYVMAPHTHDFHEMIWVLSGRAWHETPSARFELMPQSVVLVRPTDAHSILVPRGRNLRYINVAFRSDVWLAFVRLAGLDKSCENAVAPPHCVVPDHSAATLREAFERMLPAWHDGVVSRWPVFQLWSAATPLLHGESTVEIDRSWPGAPGWLQHGATAMRDAENLRGGVARFQALCGVSAGHLARTLKTYSGQSPSEWVIERKLVRAARLLQTTPLAVEEIARDCGFGNSAYFYRAFARRFAVSPRAFRNAARNQVTP